VLQALKALAALGDAARDREDAEVNGGFHMANSSGAL
jgi:hypothetical protein